jgi:hypothetical protein
MNDTDELFPVEQLAIITFLRIKLSAIEDTYLNSVLEETPVLRIVSIVLEQEVDKTLEDDKDYDGVTCPQAEMIQLMKLESLWIIVNLFMGD